MTPRAELPHDVIVRMVAASTAASGVPELVEDPVVARAIAGHLADARRHPLPQQFEETASS